MQDKTLDERNEKVDEIVGGLCMAIQVHGYDRDFEIDARKEIKSLIEAERKDAITRFADELIQCGTETDGTNQDEWIKVKVKFIKHLQKQSSSGAGE